MREKILGLLGLMRRANAISPGEDSALEALRAGKGKLLLLAADVSDNARRKAENQAAGRRVELIALPFSRDELGGALGLGGCSMAVITDLGFAGAFTKLLAAEWPEEYGELAARIQGRTEKAARRKAQKGSKQVGTRRTNV